MSPHRPRAALPRGVFALVAVVTLASLAACTSHSDNNIPAPSLSAPLPESSTSLRAPASASSSALPEAVLPHECTQLLPLAAIEQALGAPLKGGISYLRAAPLPQSGRTGRVTCDYGTPLSTPSAAPGASSTPSAVSNGRGLVEASYITYVDAKTATARVALTVQTDGQTSTISHVTVAGKPGFVLLGKEWNELVMADGARTIVVEASPAVLPAAKAPAALAVMAQAVLKFDASPSSGPPSGLSSSPASGPPSAASS